MPSLQLLLSYAFAIFLPCSLLIEMAKAVPFEPLTPRKEVDANIWCNAFFPNPQPWPANVPPRSSYPTLLELCAKNRDLANVGCLCDSPYNQVECRPALGDPVLRANFLMDCLGNCFCRHTNNPPGPPPPGFIYGTLPGRARQGPNPFADMVRSPFESQLERQRQAGQRSGVQ